MTSVTALVLAAGSSTRFGGNKLIEPLSNGVPMAVQSVQNLLQVFDDVVVVVRPDDTALMQALTHQSITLIENTLHQLGMSSSIIAGVNARPDADAWLIALADMPYINVTTYVSIAQALANGSKIVAPMYQNRRGHPIAFTQKYKGHLLRLAGDRGARNILQMYKSEVDYMQTDDKNILIDIDMQSELV